MSSHSCVECKNTNLERKSLLVCGAYVQQFACVLEKYMLSQSLPSGAFDQRKSLLSSLCFKRKNCNVARMSLVCRRISFV